MSMILLMAAEIERKLKSQWKKEALARCNIAGIGCEK
jgi:hypothetical protein